MAAIVVQFGLATMPLGMSSSASGLTSDTTSGTSGSMRQAEELSMTVAPAAATTGASSREVCLPGREQREVEARPVGGGRVLDGDLAVAPRQRAPGRPGGGEQADLVDREPALGQHLPHHATDLAGGSDDANAHGRQATSPPAGGGSRLPAPRRPNGPGKERRWVQVPPIGGSSPPAPMQGSMAS